jgi:uncharacterized protein (UPF0548 family)
MKTEWRIARGWTARELADRREGLRGLSLNFPEPVPGHGAFGGDDPKWNRYFSQAVIDHEPPGRPRPSSSFARACDAITRYEFSSPDIVMGHFDPSDSLLGRRMLLEIEVLGLHYLCGVVVGATRYDQTEEETVFGYRYDTLEGHLEAGSEWFLLTKKHETGEIWFRIQASWHEGEFPNWWSRTGFQLVGPAYQRAWHRLAYLRLRKILGAREAQLRPIPRGPAIFKVGLGQVGLNLNLNLQLEAEKHAKKQQ